MQPLAFTAQDQRRRLGVFDPVIVFCPALVQPINPVASLLEIFERAVDVADAHDREVLERELRQSGPEGAAAAWGLVDAGLRAERANLDCLRDGLLLADLSEAPSWASELCGVAVRWWAWEIVRRYGEADGGRTWAALEAAMADLRERRAGGGDDRGNPAHDALTADSWRVALDLVLRELDGFVGAHRAAITAVYARAHRAEIA